MHCNGTECVACDICAAMANMHRTVSMVLEDSITACAAHTLGEGAKLRHREGTAKVVCKFCEGDFVDGGFELCLEGMLVKGLTQDVEV